MLYVQISLIETRFVYLLITMSSAEMIVLFLSLRYFVTGKSFRLGIPSRYIFLSVPAFSINSQTGAASTPASYIWICTTCNHNFFKTLSTHLRSVRNFSFSSTIRIVLSDRSTSTFLRYTKTASP